MFEGVKAENPFDFCPTCGEQYISSCRCPKSDRFCPQGHHWHKCVKHNVIVVGQSDHSKPTFDCSCQAGGSL